MAAAAVSWLCAGCATAPPPRLTATPPALLTVITWNLHDGRGDVRRLIADLEMGRVTGAPVADYILLLQEFGEDTNTAVLGSPPHLSVFVAPVRQGMGNAIVATVPLEDAHLIQLPRERQPRNAATATVRLAGEVLFVVSTHLENRLGWLRGLFGDRARERQARALLERLPSGHGIVGGDMNTMLGPDEPALDAFLNRFPDTPGEPQPTFRERLVLDHLFFDLPDGWYATRQVMQNEYGSDHRPVIGEIRRR